MNQDTTLENINNHYKEVLDLWKNIIKRLKQKKYQK